ncbi:response regulator transcription factor [Gulosibacter molinativorax]|uniref:DNA-binding response regulator n=1 Tax=Gulosibacter molinativorax TaxID=256821 RepID=A0ABT7CAM2_9MICO|nr:response regulator transcription factor [Gulosibacter molinativorax]MDJ1372245.1 DNA-binding response regulator [Gulosibacter molinativorax]QUY63472.1 Two-component response regulator (YvqE) responding to cell wall stress [Gulosibacter molinativorax]
MIRLVLADDHPIVRAGLRALFELEPDLEVVAEAGTPDEAVRLAEREHPDVVLMDLQFGAHGASGGAEATRAIRGLAHPPYVLVLTNYDSDADILGAIEAGASGYLLKDAPPSELIAAVRAAAAGESALAPVIASRLLDRMRIPQTALSAREMEVLGYVAEGKTNAEIASALFLSETTVKSHLGHVFTKLGVTTRTAAVAEARERGILR